MGRDSSKAAAGGSLSALPGTESQPGEGKGKKQKQRGIGHHRRKGKKTHIGLNVFWEPQRVRLLLATSFFLILIICWLPWVFAAVCRLFSSCKAHEPCFSCSPQAPRCGGFSLQSTRSRVERALEQLCAWAQLPHSKQSPPGPGMEPMSPALLGGFPTTEPPGRSLAMFSWKKGTERLSLGTRYPYLSQGSFLRGRCEVYTAQMLIASFFFKLSFSHSVESDSFRPHGL